MNHHDLPRSSPWEILPIWLYLTALHSSLLALRAFTPSLSKRILLTHYPFSPWQEATSLAARQFGFLQILLTIIRLHAGMSIHSAGAYNMGVCAAAVLLVHYASERVVGTMRGCALSAAEGVALVTFVWMMVQRGEYVDSGAPFGDPEASILHPMQGGPYYPDKPYVMV